MKNWTGVLNSIASECLFTCWLCFHEKTIFSDQQACMLNECDVCCQKIISFVCTHHSYCTVVAPLHLKRKKGVWVFILWLLFDKWVQTGCRCGTTCGRYSLRLLDQDNKVNLSKHVHSHVTSFNKCLRFEGPCHLYFLLRNFTAASLYSFCDRDSHLSLSILGNYLHFTTYYSYWAEKLVTRQEQRWSGATSWH